MIVAGATRPLGLAGKLLRLNWPLLLLTASSASLGFLMLYSVAGGDLEPWAGRQMTRFGVGFAGMMVVALIDIRFWRAMAPLAYAFGLALLAAVELIGVVGMGAQRWIDLGPIQLQPSEIMKVALVMALAAYYAWLPPERVSRPLWLLPPIMLTLAPVALTLMQPDLGTALLLLAGGAVMIFLAGAHWLYFAVGTAGAVSLVWLVLSSRGTPWQLLKDYQFRRIETFLDPSTDPLGAGYHITQSKIALGSGGFSGRGFMQGTQSRLNFLPEKHTDFIFTALAEEFGFVGAAGLLSLYVLILVFCGLSAITNRDRFGALVTAGVGAVFFTYFFVNMAMVMGLAPVVGVPLPLVSYGGSAMLVILFALGLAQSAHIHRPAAV
ncbi:rod shape-determining protein RodA [Rubrimonas cliftonensis]|uniref:Peptidoglycan glycosyltransferase MrdB n=1 Tax=Rubrimonas cliftonensis TaxID=89524 RepID=A0A1H3W343_9RHOB|nr:rod shape-determining protein RodA [Rubrimonas cliftonensis]SDZ81440.1 cell elongation-specific peptidoglycan biosynthesis regulator RodA [Rubrimonas cliftonensis]